MPHPVTPQMIASLGDRPAITAFFGTLGYDVSQPEELTAASLGVPERIQHMVSQIWRIAAETAEPSQPAAREIYGVEATSVTADLRKNLANIVRNRVANALLVVTPKDSREIHLVLPVKSVAEGVTGAGVSVAHRWLALDRRRPMVTHLRALNRMMRARTAAGAKLDPYAQFDRL